MFPNNIRPLNSAVEDTAAPVTPTKDLPVFPPEEGPVSLRITRRDSTSITLAWDPPPGKLPTLYNLLMDRVSVYSGSQKSYSQTGLTAEKCYVFQVAAYVDGRWTRFTKPKYTSSLENDVEVKKLDEQNAELRNIGKTSTCKSARKCMFIRNSDKCKCYLRGSASGGGSVEYNAEVADTSITGVEASVLNCQVSKCLQNNGLTTTLIKPRQGHLKLRLDDASYRLRFLSIPENSHILEFNSPNNAFTKSTINLLGCRANELDEENQQRIGKTGVAARKCLMLNCTREYKLYYFVNLVKSANTRILWN